MKHIPILNRPNVIIKKCFGVLIVSLTLLSCNDSENKGVKPKPEPISALASTYTTQVATEWIDMQLQLLDSSPEMITPFASRTLGYTNLALYETLVPGSDNASLLNQLNGFSYVPIAHDSLEYNWGLAANVAQYTLIKELFPNTTDSQSAAINALRLKYENLFKEGVSQEVIQRSIVFGAAVANAVWDYARHDGFVGADTLLYPDGYIYRQGLGAWEPFPADAKPLLPQLKLFRPFILTNKFLQANRSVPFSYRSTSDFFLQAKEVYEQSLVLDAMQKATLDYWTEADAGNAPVLHNFGIVNEAVKQKKLTLDNAARYYLKTALAMHDAVISVWRNKYDDNLVRPVTYIRETIKSNWQPYIKNPSSPGYPSLNTALAGVVADALKNDLGVSSNIIVGNNRPIFDSIEAYRFEVIDAAIKSGTNIRVAAEDGYSLGQQISQNTNTLRFIKTDN